MANLLALDFQHPDTCPPALETLRSILASGGVIAFPTETFYGLGADPFNPAGVRKLFRLKNRPPGQPVLVLIDRPEQLSLFTGEVSRLAESLMARFWPGPLTLLFPAKAEVPETVTGGTGKIGVRQPGLEFTRRLIQGLGHPLTAPSANRQGRPPLNAPEAVLEEFGDELDAVVTGALPPGGQPSTVADPTGDRLQIIREGVLPHETLEACRHGLS